MHLPYCHNKCDWNSMNYFTILPTSIGLVANQISADKEMVYHLFTLFMLI